MPVPNVGPRSSTLRGGGHGRVVQQGVNGANDPPLVGEPASPCACHQERAHKLSAYPQQQSECGRYPGEDTRHFGA